MKVHPLFQVKEGDSDGSAIELIQENNSSSSSNTRRRSRQSRSDSRTTTSILDNSNVSRQNSIQIADENNDRYRLGGQSDEPVAFAKNFQSETRSKPTSAAAPVLGLGAASVPKNQYIDNDGEEETVDFVGLDDEAENVLGMKSVKGKYGFIDKEIEEKVSQMANLLNEYKKRSKKLRKMHEAKERENRKLVKELAKLEEEQEMASMDAGRDMRMIQYKVIGNQFATKNDKDAKNRRKEANLRWYTDQQDYDGAAFGNIVVHNETRYCTRFTSYIKQKLKEMRPLQKDLRRIEARFGSSVASYFQFYYWMLMNYGILGIFLIIFLIRHIYSLLSYQFMLDSEKAARYNSVNEPLTYYKWTAYDWLDWYSLVPRFILPSSFNPGDTSSIYFTENMDTSVDIYTPNGTIANLTSSTSVSFDSGERLDYLWMIFIFNIIIVASSVIKWIAEDRKAKMLQLVENLERQTRFAQQTLCAWDHSLTDEFEIQDYEQALLGRFVILVHEKETENIVKQRTRKERLKLLARRVIANLLLLGIQIGSAFLILYLTATSSQLSTRIIQYVSSNSSLYWLSGLLTFLSSSIVPLAVSAINALLPTLLTFLTNFEKWDDRGFHTKLMLGRLFVAKNVNAVIQIFSYIQLLDPYLLLGAPFISVAFDRNTRTNTAKRLTFRFLGYVYSESVLPGGFDECRADVYGAGIFQLVVTEFVVSQSSSFFGPFIAQLISRIRGKPTTKREFEVARKMVDLLYFQQLCFMSFLFAPFGSIIIAIFMYLGFKLQSNVAQKYMAKPRNIWSAKDAANYFVKLYFLNFVISFLVTFYVCAASTLPRACPLEQNIALTQFGTTNPIGECYDTDAGSAVSMYCPLATRTIAEIEAGSNKDTGLEELKFWEEYFTYTVPSDAASNTTIDVELYLRERSGYSENAVSYPALLVCSLSCGPFIFERNVFSIIGRFLDNHVYTARILITDSPLTLWMIVIFLILQNKFKMNTIQVLRRVEIERDNSTHQMVATLEGKIRRLEKQLQNFKSVEESTL